MTDQYVDFSKQREVNTYAEMWHTSRCLLDAGVAEPEGCAHQFRASLVFTAFTLEAFLNHLGLRLFGCWEDLESLGPRPKLNLICEHLSVTPDYSARPWQVVTDLFRFRNDIAHGKSETLVVSERISVSDLKDDFSRIPTKWEAYGTRKNAVRAREDVEQIIRTLFDAGEFPGDMPFWHGIQSGRSILVRE